MAEPVVALLESVWSSIANLGRELDDASWARPTDCPGWSVQDHVAHVIGTERTLLGEQPPPADVGRASHVRNDIGNLNEQWVESYRARPGTEVLAAFEEVTARRLDMLRAMTTEQFDAEGFTPEGPGPYRQFMAIRVFDSWFHEQDIREAIDRPGELEGPVADLSIGRIERGLPFVVGKKAAAPQGSTVVFDISGSPRVVVAIGVEGRAAILDAVPAAPTVGLSMSRRTYCRLAGGRWNGERALAEQQVAIDGDRQLGERVVTNMAFTI